MQPLQALKSARPEDCGQYSAHWEQRYCFADKHTQINETHPVIIDASNDRLQFNHGLVAGLCGLHFSQTVDMWHLSVWWYLLPCDCFRCRCLPSSIRRLAWCRVSTVHDSLVGISRERLGQRVVVGSDGLPRQSRAGSMLDEVRSRVRGGLLYRLSSSWMHGDRCISLPAAVMGRWGAPPSGLSTLGREFIQRDGLSWSAVKAAELGLAEGLVGTARFPHRMAQRRHCYAWDRLGSQDTGVTHNLWVWTTSTFSNQLT